MKEMKKELERLRKMTIAELDKERKSQQTALVKQFCDMAQTGKKSTAQTRQSKQVIAWCETIISEKLTESMEVAGK